MFWLIILAIIWILVTATLVTVFLPLFSDDKFTVNAKILKKFIDDTELKYNENWDISDEQASEIYLKHLIKSRSSGSANIPIMLNPMIFSSITFAPSVILGIFVELEGTTQLIPVSDKLFLKLIPGDEVSVCYKKNITTQRIKIISIKKNG